ncbi:MAG: phosphosulfolactate synthase [Solirubrobacteraceae bacterium]
MAAARKGYDEYLDGIGVAPRAPAICPFDPGVAPVVLESHLEQSAHLMLSLKISMACWLIADRRATRRKLDAARDAGVPTNAGGGPYEVAVAQGALHEYLELCAGEGFAGIECGSGFTDPGVEPERIVALAAERGLRVEYELGGKHTGQFDAVEIERLVEEGRRWLDAGAHRLVVEARESAAEVGLFDGAGTLAAALADRLVEAFGIELLVFEAPTKASQFALLDHLGPAAQLSNVRLDELLRVEIYRRGLHSDAFSNPRLRPPPRPARPGRKP